ncbi:tRNA uridine-5-carboxymethylaminomethyl(34) synthesis GTPase MnmE [Devosia rhodophyticola]|uniref:tRNA modification GTPase MnmE n=1 Tax=Devosia rhodophyticola TaxID=3026423 RepID=A0ABY7Z166_9HYPH|nr:tRNA uridine-5-carboxymethylaminomethyl(34) synthesis GTPase MnmE [Devosia rhodophyticola]WDR07383.1 tRNA uridine-5-carboxymethylaminomethyl(34) synthesis GTPase MnmE [Devosia rhodophyticola]
MLIDDTIVALSSGALPSGVAVIRLSGPLTRFLVEQLCGEVPTPRQMALRSIGARTILDRGLVVFFQAPHSFTGEDCAELQVHGSPAGVRAILRTLTELGARLAEAGEFTQRAFENGKLDLVAVEGLGDLLSAETESQRRQALARFEGGLSDKIERWLDQLLDLRAEIEAQLDFSDEGDVGALPDDFAEKVRALQMELMSSLDNVERGRVVREGLRVALAGPPNAGKSSLLNALANSDIAIVTQEAGTTRDVREVAIDIDGQLVVLLDLAGLRSSDSLAETEGVRRAHAEILRADLVLWLVAPDCPPEAIPETDAPILRLATKSDLVVHDRREEDISVSVISSIGLVELRERLSKFAQTLVGVGEPVLVSRERDRLALRQGCEALTGTLDSLNSPELAAESLRICSQALERLVGKIDSERVLDRLFSSFCIGK